MPEVIATHTGAPAGAVGVGQREGQRGVAGTGAQHHIADTAADQLVDDDAGLGRRGVHPYSVSQPVDEASNVELLRPAGAISPHKSTLGA
ncbi:hypothetical protein MOKP104_37350 [Mycobacterium avium subsp. hominissuis]